MPERPDVEGVLLCSGKIYYELAKEREDLKRQDVAIVRLEQLYPLPMEQLEAALGSLQRRHAGLLGAGRAGEHGRLAVSAGPLRRRAVRPACRSRASIAAASTSPATGSASSHRMEQKELLMQAFGCI